MLSKKQNGIFNKILNLIKLYKIQFLTLGAFLFGAAIYGGIVYKNSINNETFVGVSTEDVLGKVESTSSKNDNSSTVVVPTPITTVETKSSTDTQTAQLDNVPQTTYPTFTPYPTSIPSQDYNQEVTDAAWDAYDKWREEYLACLAERDDLIQPLIDQRNQKSEEYDSIPEKVKQATRGFDVTSNQLARMIAAEIANSPLLEEIYDLQAQINAIIYQYNCN